MTSTENSAEKDIRDQAWYHGPRPQQLAIKLISAPGDFLVRTVDGGTMTDFFVTACDDNHKVVHIVLKLDPDGFWHLPLKSRRTPANRFRSLVDLVEFYMMNPPSKTLKLRRIVARPEWDPTHERVKYEERDKLGSGSFGTTYKGKLLMKTGDAIVVAVKIPLVAANDTKTDESKWARRAQKHEAQTISFFAHENVLKMHGVAYDGQPLLVLAEFAPGGTLLAHLLKYGKETHDLEKLVYLHEASRGLLYLHMKRCVHGNMAARNCLVSADGRIKIADYALSTLIGDDAYNEASKNKVNVLAPVRWRAPETLREGIEPRFTIRSDTWALGVVAYEIYNNGAAPWSEEHYTDSKVAELIRGGKMPALPEGTPVRDLLTKMWAVSPMTRLDSRRIVVKCNGMIRHSIEQNGAVAPQAMTINKNPGVARSIFFKDDATEHEGWCCCIEPGDEIIAINDQRKPNKGLISPQREKKEN